MSNRFGPAVDRHCPYEEATLRQSAVNPELEICPVCRATFPKPAPHAASLRALAAKGDA